MGATDFDRLEVLEIIAVVNAASGTCCHTPREGLEILNVDADDIEGYPLLENHLCEFEQFISLAKERSAKVLVHCYAGINRSAALCMAYLLRHERMCFSQALDILLKRRGYVLGNKGFVDQL